MIPLEHGTWERYTNPDLPPNVVCARRVEDGIDWYTYRNSQPFQRPSALIFLDAAGGMQSTTDPERLTITTGRLLELLPDRL